MLNYFIVVNIGACPRQQKRQRTSHNLYYLEVIWLTEENLWLLGVVKVFDSNRHFTLIDLQVGVDILTLFDQLFEIFLSSCNLSFLIIVTLVIKSLITDKQNYSKKPQEKIMNLNRYSLRCSHAQYTKIFPFQKARSYSVHQQYHNSCSPFSPKIPCFHVAK